MKSLKWFLGLGLLLLGLFSLNACQHLQVPVPSTTGNGPVTGMAAVPTKAWTFLFYLDGDNDLDSYGQKNVDQIVSAMASDQTSDQKINVIVLYDHLGAPAELLKVTSAGVVKLADYGEPDMGAPATLQKFLADEAKAYPADHYVVDIWDHGGGWKTVCVDDTSSSKMMLDGLAQAMEAAAKQIGRDRFDITMFDACLMGMVEVVDQLKNATGYTVASESYVGNNGFPYDAMIRRLIANPSQTPGDYAKGICDDYVAAYANSKVDATVFDETKIQPLVSAIDNLAVTLLNNMSTYSNDIGKARSNAKTTTGVMGVFWYDDIRIFVNSIAQSSGDPTLQNQAAAVNAALDAALYERHTSQLDGKQTGLSINFPANYTKYIDKTWWAQNYAGIGLVFPAETHWDEMLLAYYGK